MARKRPRISKREASERAKKGWQTRWRKHGRKVKKTAAGAGAGGFIVSGGPRRTVNLRNRTKYQHVWTRPNGEVVNIKGFKNVNDFKKAATIIDSSTKRGVKLNVNHIRTEKLPLGTRKSLGGVYIPGWKQYKNDIQAGEKRIFGPKGQKEAGVGGKVFGTYAGVQGVTPKKNSAHIRLNERMQNPKTRNKRTVTERVLNRNPDLNKKAVDAFLEMDQASSTPMPKEIREVFTGIRNAGGKYQSVRFDPAGVAVHEMAHAIDAGGGSYNHLKRQKEFSQAFGWSPDKASRTFKQRKGYIGKAYQASQPVEDFAESFRLRVGGPGGTGTLSQAQFGAKMTKNRQAFLNRHYTHATPKKGVTANIATKPGMHQHVDKFIIGSAVLAAGAGGAYTYHKYRTDADFRRKVKQRTTNIKTKSKRYYSKVPGL